MALSSLYCAEMLLTSCSLTHCICLKLARFVEEERRKHVVYPPSDEVFAWTRMTDIMDVSEWCIIVSKTDTRCN